MEQQIGIITGPTGSGKSDCALDIACEMRAEIINADVGQFYEPLTIGTAKPDWKRAAQEHHLFDYLTKPVDLTVWEYRQAVLQKISEIWKRKKLPLLVGGSAFYLQSLFFPPLASSHELPQDYADYSQQQLWNILREIDPQRAAEIQPQDRYRVERALAIWHGSGQMPSRVKPEFDPLASFAMVIVERERDDLNKRINLRVEQMIDAGWIDEVKALMGTAWEAFLIKKKLIGYDDIIHYLRGELRREELITTIQTKTRQYAKRQLTFLRMFERKLNSALISCPEGYGTVARVNLTLTDVPLYIRQISQILGKQVTKKK
ncbi:tRNA (adenosine(37)-N6)-dimethylallyltransferase MiaA [Candidatus Babeliales bacterium]|nr:tRNA (adenosine(37)-N6)-dimethylallyltransferase MiaA [Candidatus Babeliales bacterium]